ncbi:MAG TPA: choice-of-anchor D domain-containing protein [Candidatus Acidoferrales bacterium]|nr:choice-of-anchor D domain-containing protein [Candidatus Acidoferrales bacterium]
MALRFAAATALIATIFWVAGESFKRVDARQVAAERGVSVAPNASAKNVVAAPLVVASGAEYANVRGLALDAAGGLYISLSATPPPQDCVSSAISAPSDAQNGASSSATKIPLTIFSNCTLARAEDPSGIAVRLQGQVYLANRTQNSIRLLDMITGKVATVPAASGKNGAAAASSSASSNLEPYQPAGLAIDRDGNLYIADRGNSRVLALGAGAQNFTYLAHVLDAAALAVDPARGELYVASPISNRVFVIDLRSGALDVLAGSGAPASSGALSAQLDSTPTKAAIAAPEGVAVDGAGNVFIADTGANALLRVDAASGTLARVATTDNLNSPGPLAIDRQGNVFVADRGNQRVLEFPRLATAQASSAVTLSPASFDFGDEPTGGSTPVQQFTLANNSANALALSNQSFAFTGADPLDFTQTNNCVPSVPAGGSCLINVTFTPGGTGARSATLQVTDADPSSPQSASLSGTGDDFQLTAASPTATIQNVAPGGTANYSLSVTPDSVFSGVVTLACPAIISGQTQTITCTTNPTSVTVTPGQAQAFAVKLTTGGPNATRIIPFARRPGSRMRILLLCVFALALALCAFYARRAMASSRFAGQPRRIQRARFAAIFFALLAAAAAAGCKSKAPPFNPNETQPGSYSINITGSAQNASRSIKLTLNVD